MADGVPTPTGKRAVWSQSVVGDILGNPAYTGKAVGWKYRTPRANGRNQHPQIRPESEQILLPDGTIPPLVDPTSFAAVADRLRRNKAQAPRNNHDPEATLLRAGFARCGHCRRAMSTVFYRGYWRYVCSANNRDPGSCRSHSISAAQLDCAAWSRVESVLTQPGIIAAQIARMRAEEDPSANDLASLDRALAEQTRRRTNLVKRLAAIDDDERGRAGQGAGPSTQPAGVRGQAHVADRLVRGDRAEAQGPDLRAEEAGARGARRAGVRLLGRPTGAVRRRDVDPGRRPRGH
jgi:site-specific DNA recombinase